MLLLLVTLFGVETIPGLEVADGCADRLMREGGRGGVGLPTSFGDFMWDFELVVEVDPYEAVDAEDVYDFTTDPGSFAI